MITSSKDFKLNAQTALKDPIIRNNFRGAMDFLRQKRATAFDDADYFTALSTYGESIKRTCLQKLPQLLEQLETNCTNNGIQVHWAETIQEANKIIEDIATSHQAKQIVKGKSMVTEELGLNDYMASKGVECLETDMGEYIVQLNNEHPSHIIMPAIHKNVSQIAALFEEHISGIGYTENVDALINAAREKLRQKFKEADIGVTGVNFAVAETGTLCLVENEGNGRMTSTVPDVHIAVTGIEKVIESLAQVPPLLELLTRSATGQIISTYFNMITSPRRPDEHDGPKEIHLVLVDNGRTQAFDDEELRQTLQCIRCGACMNHCPVYTRIGGHAYGTVYPGPIGKIISPHMLGIEDTKDLPTASSMCGACEEVCPVNIPIPKILQRLRYESNKVANGKQIMKGEGHARSSIEATIWKIWAWVCKHPAIYRLTGWFVTRLRKLIPNLKNGWTMSRAMPKPAKVTLGELMKQRKKS